MNAIEQEMDELMTEQRLCQTCGAKFESLEITVLGQVIRGQLHCDSCVDAYNARMADRANPAKQEPKSKLTDYPNFDPNHPKLPSAIKPHLHQLDDWEDSPRGIGFLGPSFLGKTRAIYDFARNRERYGINWAVISDSEVNSMVRDNTNFGAAQRRKLEEVKKSSAILWDDFGVAKMSDAVEKFYLDVLSHAQRKETPIFATLNKGGKQLLSNWQSDTGENRWTQGEDGKRILNRLFERCEVINLFEE